MLFSPLPQPERIPFPHHRIGSHHYRIGQRFTKVVGEADDMGTGGEHYRFGKRCRTDLASVHPDHRPRIAKNKQTAAVGLRGCSGLRRLRQCDGRFVRCVTIPIRRRSGYRTLYRRYRLSTICQWHTGRHIAVVRRRRRIRRQPDARSAPLRHKLKHRIGTPHRRVLLPVGLPGRHPQHEHRAQYHHCYRKDKQCNNP